MSSAATLPLHVDVGGHTTQPDIDIEHGLPTGWGEGLTGRSCSGSRSPSRCSSSTTAVYSILPSQVLRAVHVGFLASGSSSMPDRQPSLALAAPGLIVGLGRLGLHRLRARRCYHWVFYGPLSEPGPSA